MGITKVQHFQVKMEEFVKESNKIVFFFFIIMKFFFKFFLSVCKFFNVLEANKLSGQAFKCSHLHGSDR